MSRRCVAPAVRCRQPRPALAARPPGRPDIGDATADSLEAYGRLVDEPGDWRARLSAACTGGTRPINVDTGDEGAPPKASSSASGGATFSTGDPHSPGVGIPRKLPPSHIADWGIGPAPAVRRLWALADSPAAHRP